MAQSSQKTRFYDFGGMTITPQTKAPGVTLIFGDSVGRSICQEDDPDLFRICLGEIRDTYRAIPRGERVPVDVAFAVVGSSAVAAAADGAAAFARAQDEAGVDVRVALYPHPTQLPKPPAAAATLPRWYGADVWQRQGRALTQTALTLREAGPPPSGLSYLNVAVRSQHLRREPYRADSRLLVLVVAAGEDPWGGAAELAKGLDDAVGRGKWDATVLCLESTCASYRPLMLASGGRLVPVVPRDVPGAILEAVREAGRQVNRWTLTNNPTTSGHMEVRVGNAPIRPDQFSYDPFERRVRVSDSVLNSADPAAVDVWYFPFHPSQVLAQVCPEAVQRDAKPRTSAELPCQGWMADEVVAPDPAAIIDVAFGDSPGTGSDSVRTGEGMRAFQGPFRQRGIDMAVRTELNSRSFRKGAFRVAIVAPGKAAELADAFDAVIEWEPRWNADELDRVAWRVISRSMRVPISGMPIRWDSLKVFLNGRPIEPTTKDGAGYVLRGGGLFLDVAAPIHPDSHLFAVYRHDIKKGRAGGKKRSAQPG
jgi:hypothetical protein